MITYKTKQSCTKQTNGHPCSPKRAKIRAGNAHSPEELKNNFMAKYDDYIYKAERVKVGPITAQDLSEIIRAAPNTSAGPDGLLPQDLKFLSAIGLEMLAQLLNAVEYHKKWPQHFRTAKATCLAKSEDQGPFADPMDQRILLVTNSIYRLWGKVRLRHLDHWTEG